ncbi:cysteine desulfurase [Methanocalculus alkaliphilus]|uniref:cysteine desulfurase family protein n=1 Tax=Methanocalculus alkaliphilus TaxID=768730 RepID=UPI00209E3EDF|nr:cysteine desulfurase family protein [Methanocalculus alkaliphilus]MCP1715516.1 cysteine desulfurase [Methanocalculus alkaliphilus]
MNNTRPVYMDHHATTPVDPRVLEAMLPYFKDDFGNASSIDHMYGARAYEAVEKARKQVASILNAKPNEIYFTSGATESDNIALLGVTDKLAAKGNHIITCVTEHKAVLDTAKHLEKMGKSVTYLPVDQYGMVNPADIEAAITDRTILISIMAANNEIGTIAPLQEIGEIAKKHGVRFHTDAAQAVGHIPIDVKAMKIDLLSLSGHKIYGPKGIGALYITGLNPKKNISPVMFGGGHEKGIRSGTYNVPGIVGLGKAIEIAQKEMKAEAERYKKWTTMMLEAFQNECGGVILNGHPEQRLPHNLNVCFPGIESKALIHLLRDDVAISTGSACSTTSVEASYVLQAIGREEEYLHSAIRFGLGRFTTEEAIYHVIYKFRGFVQRLRNLE